MRSMYSFLAEGDEFVPPSSKDFVLPPIFGDNPYTTKPIFLVFLSVLVLSIFFVMASRKASIVPSKLQFAGESVYAYVRNDLGKEIIGHEFMRFVPYLFTLFTFILVNNWFGIIPMLQFPTMSRISFAYVLGIITFVVFHYVGIRHHGIVKYMKDILFMPGVPKPVYILLTPIEVATYLIVRPLTISLRLFANMFAGHLLLMIFILGGEHLLEGAIGLKLVSPFAFAFGIALTFFEFLVQCLQAYIFTLLTALYIGGAIAEELVEFFAEPRNLAADLRKQRGLAQQFIQVALMEGMAGCCPAYIEGVFADRQLAGLLSQVVHALHQVAERGVDFATLLGEGVVLQQPLPKLAAQVANGGQVDDLQAQALLECGFIQGFTGQQAVGEHEDFGA